MRDAMEEQAGEPATTSRLSELPMAVNGSFTMVPCANQLTSSALLAPRQQTLSQEAQLDVARDTLYCPVSECARSAGKGQGFLSQQNLQTHYNLVHASKSYSCEICQKTFTAVSCFKRHKRECGLDYCCSVCGDKFRLKNSLYMHMKRKGHLSGYSVPREDMDKSGSKIYLQRRRRKEDGTLPETNQAQSEVGPIPHAVAAETGHSPSAATGNNLDNHSESASVLHQLDAPKEEGPSSAREVGPDHAAPLERDGTDTLYSGLQTLVVEGSESESGAGSCAAPLTESPLPPPCSSEQQQQGGHASVDLLKFSLASDSVGERTFRCSTCLKVYHKRNSLYVHQQRKGHREGFTVGMPISNGSSSNTEGEPDPGTPAVLTTTVTGATPLVVVQPSGTSLVVTSPANQPRVVTSPANQPRWLTSPSKASRRVASPSDIPRVVATPSSASPVVTYSAAAPLTAVALTTEPRVYLASPPQAIILAPQTASTPPELSTRTIAEATRPQAVSTGPQNLGTRHQVVCTGPQNLGTRHQVVCGGTQFLANPFLVQSKSVLRHDVGGDQVRQVGGASMCAEEDSAAIPQCVSTSGVAPAKDVMHSKQQCLQDPTPGDAGKGGGEASSASASPLGLQRSIAHQCSYECQCGMVFADQSTLESHERKYHSRPVVGYKCRVCGKVYLVKNSLTVHQKRKRHSGWVVVRADASGRRSGVQKGGTLSHAAADAPSTHDVGGAAAPHTVAPIHAVFEGSPPILPALSPGGGDPGYVVVPVLVPANHRLAVLAGSHATPIALLPPPPEERKKTHRGEGELSGSKRLKLEDTVDVGCQTEGLAQSPSLCPSESSDVQGDEEVHTLPCPSVYVQAGGGLPSSSDLVGVLDLGTQTEWCHLHNVDELLDFGTQTPSFLHLTEQGSQTSCMDVDLGVQTEPPGGLINHT